jgi:oligopeptide transport system permease protein
VIGSERGVSLAPAQPALTAADFQPISEPSSSRVLTTVPALSRWLAVWKRLRRSAAAVVGAALAVALLLFVWVGPLLWRVDPQEQSLSRISQAPNLGGKFRVLPPLSPFQEEIVPIERSLPPADGFGLKSPERLDWLEPPTPQAVRLRWSPVLGATGYQIYRSVDEPRGGYLGLPVGAVEVNVVSFEDAFNLEPRRYHYSVVAQSSTAWGPPITRDVMIPPGISLGDARSIRADAMPGELVRLAPRPFGTDALGRDMLSRLMVAGRVSLSIGVGVPVIALLIGTLVGAFSCLMPENIDLCVMRIIDFLQALPFLLIVILLHTILRTPERPDGTLAMIVAMSCLSWMDTARLVRGQVLLLLEMEFTRASRLLGAGGGFILLQHILPHTLGVTLVAFASAVPVAIFTEAFVSFLGVGVASPGSSWGSLSRDGLDSLVTHPHELLFPCLFISLAVIAFNLLGDALRGALSPVGESAG